MVLGWCCCGCGGISVVTVSVVTVGIVSTGTVGTIGIIGSISIGPILKCISNKLLMHALQLAPLFLKCLFVFFDDVVLSGYGGY